MSVVAGIRAGFVRRSSVGVVIMVCEHWICVDDVILLPRMQAVSNLAQGRHGSLECAVLRRLAR